MLPADGKCPAISAAERRAGVAICYLSQLTGNLIEEEQQLSAAVTIGGHIQGHNRHRGNSKELADNLAALGKITSIQRQVRQTGDVAVSISSWRWKSRSGTSD